MENKTNTRLRNAVAAILKLESLQPEPQVNAAFNELVAAVIKAAPQDMAQITIKQRRAVQAVCAMAESELETYWANRICAAIDSKAELNEFPYRENYRELVRREIGLVEETGISLEKKRALVVGSGPLPMSSLEMHRQRGMHIDHVDVSEDALLLCRRVSEVAGLACEHYLADGRAVKPEKQYDLILIAALAGETLEQKQAIVNNLLPALAPDGRFLLRSSHGARELLYRSFVPDKMMHLRLLQQYHPTDEVINSVCVYERSVT